MARARFFGSAFVALAVLFALPQVGAAQTIDTAGKTLTLKGANGEGGVYSVNEKTTIMSGDKKIALGDLKKGWRVAVNGDKLGGKNVATYMEVVETDTK